MNTFAKTGFFIAASALALASVARAQLQTYETQSSYQGSTFTFFGGTLGQTFTNVSAVKSMTYNFFGGSGGATAATNLTAVFGEWNGSGFVSNSTVSFGTITVPASTSGWTTLTNSFGTYNTYAYDFDLASINSALINQTFGYLTDSTKTYALMLTDTTGGANNLALGLTNANAFAFGATNFGFNDWTFAQIVVAPGNQQLVPVPESSTVAAVGSAALVAGLVGFRLRQRRSALQTVVPAAAA